MIKITRLSAPDAPVTRLRVDGRIVLSTAREVATACHAALADGPPVLLDLSGVSFVDAEGAGALTALERRNVTIIAASPFIGALIRSHVERGDDDEAIGPGPMTTDAVGGSDGFAACVRREGPRLLALAKRLFHHDAAAADAVRTAFLDASALEAPNVATVAARLRLAVARNACARVRGLRPADADAIAGYLPRFDTTGHWVGGVAPLELPTADASSAHLHAAVGRAIDELPAWFRTILVLRDLARLDTEAVASLLAIAPADLRADLHRGRQALRVLLARELDATAEHLPA